MFRLTAAMVVSLTASTASAGQMLDKISMGPHAQGPAEITTTYEFRCEDQQPSIIKYRQEHGKPVELIKLTTFGVDYADNGELLAELNQKKLQEVWAECFPQEVLIHMTTYDEWKDSDIKDRVKRFNVHIASDGRFVIK